jgi:hypothetical protein
LTRAQALDAPRRSCLPPLPPAPTPAPAASLPRSRLRPSRGSFHCLHAAAAGGRRRGAGRGGLSGAQRRPAPPPTLQQVCRPAHARAHGTLCPLARSLSAQMGSMLVLWPGLLWFCRVQERGWATEARPAPRWLLRQALGTQAPGAQLAGCASPGPGAHQMSEMWQDAAAPGRRHASASTTAAARSGAAPARRWTIVPVATGKTCASGGGVSRTRPPVRAWPARGRGHGARPRAPSRARTRARARGGAPGAAPHGAPATPEPHGHRLQPQEPALSPRSAAGTPTWRCAVRRGD